MNLNFLYFFVKGCDMYGNDVDYYLGNYFESGGGFTTAAIIAATVAVVFISLFYGCIGNFVHRLSTKLCWGVAVVLVGLSTIGVTQLVVVGSEESNSGFFASANDYFETDISPYITGETDYHDATQRQNDLFSKMGGVCEVVGRLHGTNVVFSLVLFIVLSLISKRFTVHTKRIPF